MQPTIRRALVLGAATATVVVATAGPVAAHVTVSSPDAAPGGYGKLVFRVPNESDTAATTKITVTMPQDAPFASVRARPVPGWDVRLTEAALPEPVEVGDLTLTEAVRTVTWTATGPGVAVDEFEEFELSVGPFPDAAGQMLAFPTVQTYADGEVARWTEPTPEDGAEPEHPAPVLELAADSAGREAEPTPATDVEAAADTDGGSDTAARTLGAVGVALGAVAVALSLRGRRSAGH